MKKNTALIEWLPHHLPPLLVAGLALAMLVLTPIWALAWYRAPFLGLLLEPNNVVSQISGKDWPARDVGVVWPERLVAVNGEELSSTERVDHLLAGWQGLPLKLSFEQPDGEQVTLSVTPVQMPLADLITLFVIPYLVGLTFLLIGLWAYRLRGELRASRALLVFASAVSITAMTFFDMNTTRHVVLLWSLSLFAAAGALIHLALVFPKQVRYVDRWPAARFIPWVLSIVLAIPTTREILVPSSPLGYILTWQVGYAYIALSMGFFLAMLTWRIFRGASAMIRQQSRVIVFGAVVAFLPMMLFYLVPTAFTQTPQEFRASIYFPLLVILPLSITYAILRYRLLDVDRFFASVLTYMLMTASALAVFYGLVTGLSLVIQRTVAADDPLLIAMYLLLLVLGLSPLKNLVQRAIDRLFYRAPADYRRVLNDISTSLVVTPNIGQTLSLLDEQLQLALAPDRFIIYLYNDNQELFLPHASGEVVYPSIRSDDALPRMLRDLKKPFWYPPNRALPEELSASETYLSLGCSAFVPLQYEGNLIGFMAFGLKRSGEPYTSDDFDFLTTAAGQSSLALENARLFQNIQRMLDQTLEMKNLMDDIFASIATGVITTDLQRKVTLFNQAAERILGVSGLEVIGKPLPDALPELCPDFDAVAVDALERGTITLSKEVSRKGTPRGDVFLSLSCAPLRDAYLGTKGATIVFEDLTERRKLEAEQERIRQTFGRVVAPRVRDRLLADRNNLRLDGIRQPVTILFADISGFTSFSEVTETGLLFKVLNDYLSLAAQAILGEEGTLDKFMGDAVMALWNAPDPQPDHALRAVRAAVTILEQANQAHQRLKDPTQHLQFCIGVSTGEAMVGNVGTRQLFNYTAIGDTVNLAQRLETTAKPGQILIDQGTYAIVCEHVIAKPLAVIQVKGRSQPVEIYDLLGTR